MMIKNEEQKKLVDRAFSEAYVMVCCMNDIADNAMEDAIAQLRKSKHYKQDVKYWTRMAREAYNEYERALRLKLQSHGAWNFWMDFADEFYERVKIHVLKLRIAIKQNLDNNRVPESELLSYVQAADIIIQWTIANFDGYFQGKQETTGINLAPQFAPARLKGVAKWWGEITAVLMKKVWFDFLHDERCVNALQCMINQLLLVDNLNKAGETALAMNMDLVQERQKEIHDETESDNNESK